MIYFTSDQHFNHRNVIKYCKRPFAPEHELLNEISDESLKFMNEELIRKFNEVVTENDVTYHLGDFSFNHKYVTEILSKLNGEHHLIAGNHDQCHPANYRSKIQRGENMKKIYLEAGFKSIKLTDIIEIAEQKVNLCHLPYKGAGDYTGTERYSDYRLEDNGDWLLHGHVHDFWKIKGKQINVGVDVWDFKPVSITEIEKIIRENNA